MRSLTFKAGVGGGKGQELIEVLNRSLCQLWAEGAGRHLESLGLKCIWRYCQLVCRASYVALFKERTQLRNIQGVTATACLRHHPLGSARWGGMRERAWPLTVSLLICKMGLIMHTLRNCGKDQQSLKSSLPSAQR